MMTDGAEEVRWEPRVGRGLVRRLYASEAAGRLDEALLDEVGTRFALRCEAILTASEAMRRRVACPRCARAGRRTVIPRGSWDPAERLRCPACGWAATWGAYHARCRSRQLNEGGAGGAFRGFLEAWRGARTPGRRMIAVDQLLHAFHVYLMRHRLTGETRRRHARSVAVQLLQGKLAEVVAFLDELSGVTPRSRDLSASASDWRARRREADEDPPWRGWRIVRSPPA